VQYIPFYILIYSWNVYNFFFTVTIFIIEFSFVNRNTVLIYFLYNCNIYYNIYNIYLLYLQYILYYIHILFDDYVILNNPIYYNILKYILLISTELIILKKEYF